jgi:hypothetical protein
MRALFLVLVALSWAWGCSTSSSSSSGGSSSGSASDGGGGTDSGAPPSTCGHPGDKGNALGVGQYCEKISDCTGQAKLCSIVGDPTTHFCTVLCQVDASVSTQCGSDDMLCECGTGGCGCTPKVCVDGGK